MSCPQRPTEMAAGGARTCSWLAPATPTTSPTPRMIFHGACSVDVSVPYRAITAAMSLLLEGRRRPRHSGPEVIPVQVRGEHGEHALLTRSPPRRPGPRTSRQTGRTRTSSAGPSPIRDQHDVRTYRASSTVGPGGTSTSPRGHECYKIAPRRSRITSKSPVVVPRFCQAPVRSSGAGTSSRPRCVRIRA